MNKHTWAIAKLNLRNIKTPYFVTGLIFSIIFVQSIVYTIIAVSSGSAGEQLQISSGNYSWLLIIMAAIFIPTKNFSRIVNLGGKRDGFFWGSLSCYATLAGAVTIANTFLYYTYERLLISTGYYSGYETLLQNPAIMDNHYISVNLIEVFGWLGNGAVIAFVQQFAFLFLLASVVHTLTAMQDKWYGWVTDAVIAAILGVFIPIAPLRVWLIRFFNLIIFNSNAFMQIAACMLIAIAVYAMSKLIFVRKAI
jgi:hypothetical protein